MWKDQRRVWLARRHGWRLSVESAEAIHEWNRSDRTARLSSKPVQAIQNDARRDERQKSTANQHLFPTQVEARE